ncbi:MAG: TonB-dependent receptor plug domain-containing protein, partial [Muribaculaceae bacterium]|nr:TonB-dependent receptor plug domain-containing protein [Muribaculaceae bacterium]
VEALNGLVTGMNMTESNTLTGDPTINIRGISSINASNEPLIVLDGMPYSGYMTDINASDIASMTVLKDAASNALYGARGANGVILITTKSASRGKTKVTLNAKWGANTDGRVRYETIDDPGQYYEAFYTAWKNYNIYEKGMNAGMAHVSANQMLGAPVSEGGLGYMVYAVPQGEVLIGTNGRLNPNAVLGNRVANNGRIYTLYPDDWTKEGLRNGFRQEYNATVSTGNDRYTMFASLGYLGNEGLSYGSSLERISARLKMDAQLYPFLRVGASSSYIHSSTNTENNVFDCLVEVGPIYPLFIRDENGNIMTDKHGKMYDYGDGIVNGQIRTVDQNDNYIQADLINEYTNKSNAFSIQGYATVDFLDGFHFTVNGSTYITENRINNADNPWYGYGIVDGGSILTGQYRTSDINSQQLLNYSKEFNGHSIDVLLGHEYSRVTGARVTGTRYGTALYETNKELSGAITITSNSGYRTNYNVEGWFLRAQYDYLSKYFGSFSFRRDGSSRFHPKHRWGNFWSVGAAWIATKEEWFPKTEWLDMLKIKASYGEQGNDGIGNYLYTNTYSLSNANGQPSFIFSKKGNENITWETVGSFNAGLQRKRNGSR